MPAFRWTTGPRTTPGVPGDQPADSSRSRWRVGDTTWPLAVPRVQPRAIFQGSSLAFCRPYSLNLSRVHSLARLRLSDPVSRGPITSQRYSRFAMSCECSSTSFKMAWVIARTSAEGRFGAGSGDCARAAGAAASQDSNAR